MLVQVILDKPHGHFTNLDIITGRIALSVTSTTAISHITVKLEGESRTRLIAPPQPYAPQNSRPRPVLEIHKLLYKIRQVFPPEGGSAQSNQQGTQVSYVIQPGNYVYPFEFKLPFNNACNSHNTGASNLNFAGFQLEVARAPTQHVKATLPPSIYFPGEAEIRYYVKVTVNRPSLLKENPRSSSNFNFVPIEPPRPITDGETYARRQHQFLYDQAPPLPDRKGSGFGDMMKRKLSAPVDPATDSRLPARFSVDARLPNPAILTCGQDVPLKILIKQMSERSEPLHLQTLQIELVGHTQVRAHEAVRTETNSWVITSLSNLSQTIGNPSDVVGTETALTKEFWYGHRLPDTVAPSFVTCNISRSYELVISVGLSYGGSKMGAGLPMNQFIVLPLRLKVEVFSGITPPADLLKRMVARPHSSRPGSQSVHGTAPPTYSGPSRPSAQSAPQPSGEHEDAPPSYEDAVASDLPPLAGPRPAYSAPAAPEGESRITGDEKRR